MHQDYDCLSSYDDKNFIVFGSQASATTSSLTAIWHKPTNISVIDFLLIGSGSGGGGGGANAAGSAAAGGRGGGSGGRTLISIPAILVPNTLYLYCGRGGLGGAGQIQGGSAGVNGSSGEHSTIYAAIDDFAWLKSSNAAASGGQAGSGITNGTTGGAAGSAALVSSAFAHRIGIFAPLVGVAGGSGGQNAAGSSVQVDGMTSGGSGGGGVSSANATFTGGNITTVGEYPTSLLGSNNTTPGARGFDGYDFMTNRLSHTQITFSSTGGMGGTSNTGAAGGDGGNGGPGSGGGGGGGANGAGVAGGRGGNGGPGVIGIFCR